MSDQLTLVNVDAPWRRALLLVPAALALWGVWACGRWFVGDTLANYPPNEQFARAAERLAPDDPQAHFTVGVFARRSFEPSALDETAREFARATALSPHDYRLWMELGRAREQAGDGAGGELALRRARELAPNYVMPRWYLGNLLLRAGRDEEALGELRAAAESDTSLRGPIFASVWAIFGGDVGRVTAAIAGSPSVRGELIVYLIGQKRTDDALKLWATLGANDKRAQRAAGDALVEALLAAKRINAALAVFREADADGERVSAGQVTNGGFEDDAGAAGRRVFDWSVTPVAQAQTGVDPNVRHAGARSLRVSFNAPSSIQYANVTQLVAVEPGARYRLEFFVRTESLKSVATLVVDVAVARQGGAAIATSAPAPAGTSDWQQVALEFNAPQDADGVVLLIRRQPCKDEACPIFGKIWYDDFTLQRAGAGQQQPQQRAAARAAAAAGAAGGGEGGRPAR
ncbi:MAG TPA: carbohydrate binding domain-containing protein [Pyrinomonadaceae bacterium]|jgi:hypothetical protein